jgi:hypothetical protein
MRNRGASETEVQGNEPLEISYYKKYISHGPTKGKIGIIKSGDKYYQIKKVVMGVK